MTPSKLRFRARGEALAQNHERLEAGIKSFVGRKYIEVEPGVWGFAPTTEPEEVAYRADYVKACKDGDLWAADRATADACGVEFDSNFGVGVRTQKTNDKPAAMPAEKG